MIVVLDSSVWISALEFGGTPDLAVFRALTEDQLAISRFIWSEIIRVLTGKFARDPLELQALLDELLVDALWVEVAGSVRGICRDPLNDDAVLDMLGKPTPISSSRATRTCLASATSAGRGSFPRPPI